MIEIKNIPIFWRPNDKIEREFKTVKKFAWRPVRIGYYHVVSRQWYSITYMSVARGMYGQPIWVKFKLSAKDENGYEISGFFIPGDIDKLTPEEIWVRAEMEERYPVD